MGKKLTKMAAHKRTKDKEIPESHPDTRNDPTPDDTTEDDPTLDDLTLDDPTGDDPTLDDPTGDDPTLDDPTGDDPTLDDPTLDDPTLDDPTLDDPTLDDPTGDDPTGDDPTGDDPTGDDPTLDDPTLDDLTLDDPTLDDPTLDDPTPDDPTGDDPTLDDLTLDDPTPDDPTPDDTTWYDLTEDHPTLDDPTRDDPTRSDPLCMTSVVVDWILEHLDDRSLLTGRQVCQSWNAEITSRNNLWKKRCQQKHGFHVKFGTTVLDDVFHQYLSLHHVYRRMRSGSSFQVDTHSETLDCFHGARENLSISCFSETVPEDSDAASQNILPRPRQPRNGIVGSAISLFEGDLVMTDMRTMGELWRHEHISIFNQGGGHIYAMTSSGDLKQFSRDGRCELQIDTGGKLKDAWLMFPHSSCRFIMVGLQNYDVYMVNVDTKQIIKLQLAYPEIPEDEEEKDDDEKEEEEEEDDDEEEDDKRGPSERYEFFEIGFLSEESLSKGQLAVYAFRDNCMVIAIIDESGKILHQASKTYNEFHTSVLTPNSPYFFISAGRHVERYAICCKSSGIQINLVWQKPLPKCFRSGDAYVVRCGDLFAMGIRGNRLVIYRLDNGRLVFSDPEFFITRSNRSIDIIDWKDVSEFSLNQLVCQVANDQANQWQQQVDHGHIIVASTSWMDGLSPATMKPDVPVLLFLSDTDTDIKCLRWSADLWTGAD